MYEKVGTKNKEDVYSLHSMLTRKNKYNLNWLFELLLELKDYDYKIEFENQDATELPENCW